MKIVRTMTIAILVGLVGIAAAQHPRKMTHRTAIASYIFKIGAKQDDIRADLGAPDMIYSTATEKYYSAAEEESVMSVGGRIFDIYDRPSGGNTFRITLQYSPDGSLSRLHPTERVTQINFEPDHNAPFRTLLNQIPEVTALCKDGCSMGGFVEAGRQQIRACREPKFPNELAIMKGAAEAWQHSSGDDTIWKYCVRANFQERLSILQRSTSAPPWDDLTIDEISIGPGEDPRNDQLVKMGADTEYDLGTWTSTP